MKFIVSCSCGIVIASSRDDRILQREEREKKARNLNKWKFSLIWHFLNYRCLRKTPWMVILLDYKCVVRYAGVYGTATCFLGHLYPTLPVLVLFRCLYPAIVSKNNSWWKVVVANRLRSFFPIPLLCLLGAMGYRCCDEVLMRMAFSSSYISRPVKGTVTRDW